jgi:predicted  nucleic acid-binding Zn-ribbon protein
LYGLAVLTCLAAQAQLPPDRQADFAKARAAVESAGKELKAGWDVVKGAEQRREKLTEKQKSACEEKIEAATEKLDDAKNLIKPISEDLTEVKWLKGRIGYKEKDRDKLAKRLENPPD